MALKSTEVDVFLNGSNMKHYEDLGYFIPRKKDNNHKLSVKRGTIITVKVEDLPEHSSTKVDVKCDNCGKQLSVNYYHYTDTMKQHNQYFCNTCATHIYLSGENNPHWKSDRILNRTCTEYNNFIMNVLARDKYTCQCCGNKHCRLNVHHLDGYNWCIEKRIDEENGVTLCKTCHDNFHMKYGHGNNTKLQFEEWLGYSLPLLKFNGILPSSKQVYCIEEDKIYNSVKEIALLKQISESSLYSCCNHNTLSSHNYHYLWLSEYETMTRDEALEYITHSNEKNTYNRSESQNYLKKKIICITTNKIFNSITEAQKYYSVYITKVHLDGKNAYSGCLSDGTKLQWCYYDKYLQMKDDNIDINKYFNDLYHLIKRDNHLKRKVICLNTEQVFDSITDAEKYYNVNNIASCCQGKRKSCGIDNITHKKLKWMYYDAFLAE